MAKKRKKRRAQPTGRNRHHVLFMARNWSVGMAKELRTYFVYYLPIATHNELHNRILRNVPKPPPEALKPLYLAWKAQKAEIDQLEVIDALEWLENACDYEPFRAAIRKQIIFLDTHLNHRVN